MKKLSLVSLILILFSTTLYAGKAVIFNATAVQTLKAAINLNNIASILTGTVNPQVTATSANPGSIMLLTGVSGGAPFFKFDSGATTNWKSAYDLTGMTGDGSDGDVTISVNTTLSRNMFYHNLTVNNGITLKNGGFVIFVQGTLTNNGTIDNSGNNGSNASGNVAGSTSSAPPGITMGTGGVGASGGAGTTGAGAVGSNSTAVSGEGGSAHTGGKGGNGTSGSGGNGGTASFNPRFFRNVQTTWMYNAVGTYMQCGDGGPGGGSGAGDGTNTGRGGGGGGSGGGCVFILGNVLDNTNGTISANGGPGGKGGIGPAGNVGGGAGGSGGGGGKLMLIFNSIINRGTLTVTGGNAGSGTAGAGTGTSGANGVAGDNGYATTFEASTQTWSTTQ